VDNYVDDVWVIRWTVSDRRRFPVVGPLFTCGNHSERWFDRPVRRSKMGP